MIAITLIIRLLDPRTPEAPSTPPIIPIAYNIYPIIFPLYSIFPPLILNVNNMYKYIINSFPVLSVRKTINMD